MAKRKQEKRSYIKIRGRPDKMKRRSYYKREVWKKKSNFLPGGTGEKSGDTKKSRKTKSLVS